MPFELEEIYRPRVAKWLLVMLICAAFTGGGWLIVSDTDSRIEALVGYGCTFFFGLGALASVVPLVPGSSYLRLTDEGVTICSCWRSWTYRWSDIECFGVAEFSISNHGVRQRHKMIGLNFSESYTDRNRSRTLKSVNRRLVGFEGALPDNYGWDYAELAEHLNALKTRFTDR